MIHLQQTIFLRDVDFYFVANGLVYFMDMSTKLSYFPLKNILTAVTNKKKCENSL